MPIHEMSSPDKLECAAVLFEYIDMIKHGFVWSLPPSQRTLTLVNLGGVLTDDGALCPDFRKVLANVIDGRDIEQLTYNDLEAVACRYKEWLSQPQLEGGLGSLWYTEAYKARSRR